MHVIDNGCHLIVVKQDNPTDIHKECNNIGSLATAKRPSTTLWTIIPQPPTNPQPTITLPTNTTNPNNNPNQTIINQTTITQTHIYKINSQSSLIYIK